MNHIFVQKANNFVTTSYTEEGDDDRRSATACNSVVDSSFEAFLEYAMSGKMTAAAATSTSNSSPVVATPARTPASTAVSTTNGTKSLTSSSHPTPTSLARRFSGISKTSMKKRASCPHSNKDKSTTRTTMSSPQRMRASLIKAFNSKSRVIVAKQSSPSRSSSRNNMSGSNVYSSGSNRSNWFFIRQSSTVGRSRSTSRGSWGMETIEESEEEYLIDEDDEYSSYDDDLDFGSVLSRSDDMSCDCTDLDETASEEDEDDED